MKTAFVNGKIILNDRISDEELIIKDKSIFSLGPMNRAKEIDLEGDYLCAGLLELHTDNLEKHISPRPGIIWPSTLSAVKAHDTQIIGAGITTVFDSIAIGFRGDDNLRSQIFKDSIAVLDYAQKKDLLRASHLIHLRCELPGENTSDIFEEFLNEEKLKLVSLMDHTVGQRQWRDISKWRTFHRAKSWTDEEAKNEIEKLKIMQSMYAEKNKSIILSKCKELNISVASHDDTTEEHCLDAFNNGIVISEFPTSKAAAVKAKSLGLKTIMGAPNVVREGSHSGNVSAIELANERLLDGLSSDYVPISLLHGAFMLHQKAGFTIPEAMATVTKNIAAMLKIEDRGEIMEDKRADLVRIRLINDTPIVINVWQQGERVF
ncbi:MAG: alpha-D-ribose 1-methylphosphonate 5-triphosphate diphosphatase [Spirochaetales bacterium]|nr:alpha-D-ribose 1-methylphosphonate 5-triphosphate diphosphatase [Spirochaetales bacterium]